MASELSPRLPATDLLEHRAFVGRLARELVGPQGADDLEQEAWLAALQRPPRVAAAGHGWFRSVLRHLAQRRLRDESRRTAREAAAASGERASTEPAHVLERLTLERRLVDAVEALREPYRTCIFLRYFEDLSPPAIAERHGEPLATVKTRLRRGLAQLRTTLGDDPRLRALLVAPAATASVAPSATSLATPWAAPATALASKGAVLATGVTLVVAGVLLLQLAGGDRTPSTEPPPVVFEADASMDAGHDPAGPAAPQPDAPGARASGRSSAPEEASPGAEVQTDTPEGQELSSAPPSSPRPALLGHVRFPNGQGAAGARVAFGQLQTRTDGQGAFRIEIERDVLSREALTDGVDESSALVAWLPEWQPAIAADAGHVLARAMRAGRPLASMELVLPGPAGVLSGTLLESSGARASGWRLSLLDGRRAFATRRRPLSVEELASGIDTHLETPDGRFAFSALDPERTYRLRAWNPRTLESWTSEPLPVGSTNLLLQCDPVEVRPLVNGSVHGVGGDPLEGVRCRLSMHEYRVGGGTWSTTGQVMTSDAFGRFQFRDVPHSEVFIRFDLAGSDTSIELEAGQSGRDLRVEMVRRGSFRVEFPDGPGAPDAVRFLDAEGEPLRIQVDVSPGVIEGTRRLKLTHGRAQGRVSELAHWAVFERDGNEHSRRLVLVRANQPLLLEPPG